MLPDPEAFVPGRSREERAAGRPRFAHQADAERKGAKRSGPRLCIGDQFGMTEARLNTVTVAQRCRLTPVPDHPIVVELGVTLRPKHGLLMRIDPRNRLAGKS
jgi:cytochrome P450